MNIIKNTVDFQVVAKVSHIPGMSRIPVNYVTTYYVQIKLSLIQLFLSQDCTAESQDCGNGDGRLGVAKIVSWAQIFLPSKVSDNT